MAEHEPLACPLPSASPLLLRLFARYSRSYMCKHFNALRAAQHYLPEKLPDRPAVIFLNHPSWWDPLFALVLSQHFFAYRVHHGAIEGASLKRYPFVRSMGFFPVDLESPGGARSFLRAAQDILRRPRGTLWITPQSAFTDSRRRPVAFASSIGHLAHLVPEALFVPLALDYVYWRERLPEALCAFGQPMRISDHAGLTARHYTQEMTQVMEQLLDALALLAVRRDPQAFVPITARKSATPVDAVVRLFQATLGAKPPEGRTD